MFIGYCSNCAVDKYNYARGNGFNTIVVEQIGLQIINVEDEEKEEDYDW